LRSRILSNITEDGLNVSQNIRKLYWFTNYVNILLSICATTTAPLLSFAGFEFFYFIFSLLFIESE